MKSIRILLVVFSLLLVAHVAYCKKVQRRPLSRATSVLKQNMQKNVKRGCMFGHQDDTNYGTNWSYESDRSDVKEVCGDYPAVMGFDLGHIELGNTENLD